MINNKTRYADIKNVTALGFGCMGMNYNRGMAKDEKEMFRLLHKCVDYGVNLFDTAEVYVPHINEILVGKGLYKKSLETDTTQHNKTGK